jgi:hypothetical protein
MSHRAFVAAAAGVLLLAGAVAAAPHRASSAEMFAAPAQIIVHGPGLARAIRLMDFRENHRLVTGLVTLESLEHHPLARKMVARGLIPLDTAGRGMTHVALFVRVDSALARLPMEEWPIDRAQQHAWFFPATARDEALWLYVDRSTGTVSGPRRLTKTALEILERHGVPVRAE